VGAVSRFAALARVSSHLSATRGRFDHGSSHHRSTHRICEWFLQQPPCDPTLPSPRRGRIIVLLLSSRERARRRPKARQPLGTSWERQRRVTRTSLRPGDVEAGNEPIGALGRRPERAAQPAVTCGSEGPARVWNESAGWRCAPLCGRALIGASLPTGERREDPAGARGVGAAMSPVRALSWAARRSSPVPRGSAI
jgi:hypothetical protein